MWVGGPGGGTFQGTIDSINRRQILMDLALKVLDFHSFHFSIAFVAFNGHPLSVEAGGDITSHVLSHDELDGDKSL